MTFGECFRDIRIHTEPSLRKFCAKHGFDPGNISKLERGLMTPPRTEARLQRYVKALGIKRGSDQYNLLLRYAIASKTADRYQRIFENVHDENLVRRLPDLISQIDSPSFNEQKLNALFEALAR
jgi:transcriptional regulator with XRE-family HTH domain